MHGSVAVVQSTRILITHAEIDGVPVTVDYADVFVVVREGADGPSATDWEAQVHTRLRHEVTPARHDLTLTAPDDTVYRGTAITRYSDGRRHLFRGDAHLAGFTRDQSS